MTAGWPAGLTLILARTPLPAAFGLPLAAAGGALAWRRRGKSIRVTFRLALDVIRMRKRAREPEAPLSGPPPLT